MGDPAGTGPEIAIKAWQKLKKHGPVFAISGDAAPFVQTNEDLALGANIKIIRDIEEANSCFKNALPIIEGVKLKEKMEYGSPNSKNSNAIIDAIISGTNLVIQNKAEALVTIPISKSSLYASGFKFAGHTEFVADLTKDITHIHPRGPVMMLAIEGLRVALVTIHEPLKNVSALLEKEKIVDIIRLVHNALQHDFGIIEPKIALLGLNPHAGEDGSIGKEEIEIINPAAQIAREGGIIVTNAMPADSAFSSHARAKYDCYIAMYHDQGLIPIKALDFWSGVNITLGLPIVRTSPDHGTGFDIAGKNIANEESLIAAIKAAFNIAKKRKNGR